MGKRIAINEIWKYTALDFPAGFAVDKPKPGEPKSTAIEIRFISQI